MERYIALIEGMKKDIPSKTVAKLVLDALTQATKILRENNQKQSTVPKSTKRPNPGLAPRSPKRQKVGGEALLAAQGRSSIGQPSAKKAKPSTVTAAQEQEHEREAEALLANAFTQA